MSQPGNHGSAIDRAVPSRRSPFGVPGPRPALLAGLTALLLLALMGVLQPSVALRGWLVAFATGADVALGAAAWLAIHALTGGRWGQAARPALLAAASGLPALLVLGLPLLLAAPLLYPWSADPGAAGAGVAPFYLGAWSIGARSIVLIGGMWLFTGVVRRGAPGILAAAGSLVLYGALMNLLSFDWLLSLAPRYTSSAFGMQIITAQLAAALAWAILLMRAPDDEAAWPGLAGLLLATVLGEGYLILMTLVVHWYGNLPEQAAWFLARTEGAWVALEVLGVIIGLLLPLTALLFGAVRRNPVRLRAVAALVMAGITIENLWLVAPAGPDGAWAVAAGCLAVFAWAALLRAAMARSGGMDPAREVTHGA